MEPFLKSFREWQFRFRCPHCRNPSLDFVTSPNIREPFICTYCKAKIWFTDGSKK